jgi:hypothetical protein
MDEAYFVKVRATISLNSDIISAVGFPASQRLREHLLQQSALVHRSRRNNAALIGNSIQSSRFSCGQIHRHQVESFHPRDSARQIKTWATISTLENTVNRLKTIDTNL